MNKFRLLVISLLSASFLFSTPIWMKSTEVQTVLTSLPEGASISGDVQLDIPLAEGADSLVVTLDGEEILSSSEAVDVIWQPQKLGEQTLLYTSGDMTLERTVNVTGFSYAVQPEPEPPMEVDSAISITPATRSFSSAGGANAIVTSGSGTWTAAVSDSWITLNTTSGEAGYPVAYTVTVNPKVESRIGYVYVSGHVHTITQEGLGATINPTSGSYEAQGGSGTVTVFAQNQVVWEARSNVDWISMSPTSGVGEQSVTYTVAPFDQVSTRQGTLTIAGNTVTVFQYGRRMKLSSYSVAQDWYTHVIPVTVNALAITEWSVTPNASWISVVDAGNGKGSDTVSIAISENPSYKARTGTVTIGTETFTVTQDGRTDLVFTVSPAESTASVNGANGLIAVTATPDLPWSAKSESSWVTVYSTTATGAGNGNVVYVASPQSTLFDRTGTITITPDEESGMPVRTHTVTQPAATSSLSALGYEFAASGESYSVTVAVADIVEWEISESLDWLSVNGSTNRVGSGTVTLQVAANETIYDRSGTVTIAQKTFTVTQKGRGVEVEYEEILFGTDGGSESISIHPDGNVSWTAVVSDPTWITIFQGGSGTGDGEILYIVSPYVGMNDSRTGTITIGDKVIYITQRAYDLSIEPNGTTVIGNNGAGEFGVSASINDVWTAIATEPWITIVSGYDSGTGSGTVRFVYTDNNTGKTRTGKIIVSGEVYTIEQAARVMVDISATAERGGSVSGGGLQCVGAEVELTALPDDGYAFAYWSGDIESMANPLVFRVDVAKSLTAHFEPLPIAFDSVTSSEEGVTLSWNNLAWATTYRIYRGVTSVPSSAEVLAEITNVGDCTHFDDTGDVGVTYWYWIEAEGVEDSVMSDPMTGMKKPPIVISDITYENLCGATHTNPSTYEEGTLVTFANPSGVTGYTFAGWVPSQITAEMKGAQVIRATWTANTYSIAYSANGGSGTMANTSATYDATVTIAANGFTLDGYRFTGWATEPDGAVVYAEGATVNNLTAVQNGVVTLYAVWEEDPASGGGDDEPTYTPPSWEAPGGYQNNMTLFAQVKDVTTGTFIDAEGSLLAVFDADGVCRGVKAIGNGPNATKVYQVVICSNTASGETFTLKVWNAATGETTDLTDTIVFTADAVVGAIAAPVVYQVGYKQLETTFKPGWNWFSINVDLPEETTLSDAFTGWTPANDDQIKSSNDSATYYDGVWYPEDFKLEAGKMYLLNNTSSAAVTATVQGTPVPYSRTYPLVSGWNWMGYTGATTVAIDAAFADIVTFSDDDMVKSSSDSATYYDGVWYGSLELAPGTGYKFYLAQSTTLQYAEPSNAATLAATPAVLTAVESAPEWVAANCQYNMTVYAIVQDVAGSVFGAEGSILAAFDADGVCRGVEEVGNGPNATRIYQLVIASNKATESGLSLKLWNAADGIIYDLDASIDFEIDGRIGKIGEPQVYTVKETEVKCAVFVTVVGKGTVTGAGEYAEGDEVTLTATPADGSFFCGWNTDPVTTAATYTFTMGTDDVILTACFAPISILDAHIDKQGLLTPEAANQLRDEYIAEHKLKTEAEVAEAIQQHITVNHLMSKEAAKQVLLEADEVFTADEIEEMAEMAFETPVVAVGAEHIEVSISLQTADTLDAWQPMALQEATLEVDKAAGKVRVIVPKGEKKAAFYKFVVPIDESK